LIANEKVTAGAPRELIRLSPQAPRHLLLMERG